MASAKCKQSDIKLAWNMSYYSPGKHVVNLRRKPSPRFSNFYMHVIPTYVNLSLVQDEIIDFSLSRANNDTIKNVS